jgi:hypothetical protein
LAKNQFYTRCTVLKPASISSFQGTQHTWEKTHDYL